MMDEPEPGSVVTMDALALLAALGCDEKEPWEGGSALLAHEVLIAAPVAEPYEWPQSRPRWWHAGRVLFLSQHGWDEPLSAEVDPDGTVTLLDGHHRLHAAALLGSGWVQVEIGGWVDGMPEDLLVL